MVQQGPRYHMAACRALDRVDLTRWLFPTCLPVDVTAFSSLVHTDGGITVVTATQVIYFITSTKPLPLAVATKFQGDEGRGKEELRYYCAHCIFFVPVAHLVNPSVV